MKSLSQGSTGTRTGLPGGRATGYLLAAIFTLIFSLLLGYLVFYSSATGVPGPSIISVTSSTHPDEYTWYVNSSPFFSWSALDIRIAGSYDTPGNAYDVAISGNYAYVADNTQGLQIINVTNPAAPVLAGTFATNQATGVAVSGSYAYVSDGNAGLKVINISNPASPTLAGSRDTPGFALDVAVSGSYAYVADSDPGLQVINISNPANPVISGVRDTGWAADVAVSGSYAYVADSYTGLQVVNVSNPASPTSAGSYDTAGTAEGVAISGSYAYVADWTAGLAVFDISNPAAPALRGSYDTYAAEHVAISGTDAFVADGGAGFKLIDVSTPSTPSLKGSCDTPGSAAGIAVSGSFAYIADTYTLQDINLYPAGYSYILDQSPGTMPDATSEGAGTTASFTGKADGVWYFHVRAADSLGNWGPVSHRMIRIDTSGPPIPTLTSSTHPVETSWYPSRTSNLAWRSSDIYLKGFYATPGVMLDVAISGSRAYLADHTGGMEILDVNNPANPVFLGAFDTPGSALGIVVSGNYAYVADGDVGLQIIDVSVPAAPVLRGTHPTPDTAASVAIAGSYAYVAEGWFGLEIVNVSDPANPALAGAYFDAESYSQDVEVVGRYAYVADYYSFRIIDVLNPAAPVLAGVYDTPGQTYGVAVSGNYALVADGNAGLQVINISNPAAPYVTGTCDTPSVALGVAVSGSNAYVADAYSGLQVIDIADPASPVLKGSVATPDDALGVAFAGGHAFVADFLAGLQIYSVSDPTGYSFIMDRIPDTVPDTTSEGTAASVGVNVGSDGVWYFHVRARDYLGNWGPASHRAVLIDTVKPTTTNNAPAGWQTTNFSFTLTPTDADSGVSSTFYRIDSGTWQSGTTVSITTEGDHVVSYYSRDAAGNQETTKTVHAMLDKTAPVTTDDAPSSWVNSAEVMVLLSCSDVGGSGCQWIFFQVDGGGWLGVGGIDIIIGFSNEGDFTLEYYATDTAGNAEPIKTVHVRIDRTAPVTTDGAPTGWQTDNFKVPLFCTDALSGCQVNHFKIDDGLFEAGDNVPIDTEGDHIITYHSHDNAGNAEGDHTVHAMLDKTAPLTTDNAPAGWQNAPFEVTLTCTDAEGSGCAATHYTLDGSKGEGDRITIDTDGDHTITYHSHDNAGHTEAERTVHAKLDGKRPLIENITPSGTVDQTSQTLAADLADSGGSGINAATATISLDGGAPLAGCTVTATHISCPVSGLSEGDHTIGVSVDDLAGNNRTEQGSFKVVIPLRYYWTWYDNYSSYNWLLMANPASATANIEYSYQVAAYDMGLWADSPPSGTILPGASAPSRFYNAADPNQGMGMVGGPVTATSLTGSQAIASQRSLWKGGNSLEEVPGTAQNNQSSHYYWTWYDNLTPGMYDWVMISNPGSSLIYYRIRIGGNVPAPGVILEGKAEDSVAPGQSKSARFAMRSGPVEVETFSDPEMTVPANAIASQRVLTNMGTASEAFNEVPGTPANELTNDYLWTWYDNVSPGVYDWVLVANQHEYPIYYRITVDGQVPTQMIEGSPTGTIDPGSNVTPRIANTSDGPLEVKTCTEPFGFMGSCNDPNAIEGSSIASQRTLWGPSFEEVPGYRRLELTSNYHWTWYDQFDPGTYDWVHIINTGLETVRYQILVGGVAPSSVVEGSASGTIAAGELVHPRFLLRSGPVEVRAWREGGSWDNPGDRRPVMTSQRVLWHGYFNEVLGTDLG